jgi:hypothetical protein
MTREKEMDSVQETVSLIVSSPGNPGEVAGHLRTETGRGALHLDQANLLRLLTLGVHVPIHVET